MNTNASSEFSDIVEQLQSHHAVPRVLDSLRNRFAAYRERFELHEWRKFTMQFRAHELSSIINQSPFSRRCVQRPRGYAGDGVMLDFIYGLSRPRIRNRLASDIFDWEISQLSSIAVRERRRYIATIIDEMALRIAKPTICSIACGHFREALVSNALRSNEIERALVIDQDEEALNEVKAMRLARVVPQRLSVRNLLTQGVTLPQTHLIYSLGLYDYLEQRFAAKVTQSLVSALAPGGRLVIANFRKGMRDAAGMEATMDWWLTYRDEKAMWGLLDTTSAADFDSLVYPDATGAILYLEVRRRS